MNEEYRYKVKKDLMPLLEVCLAQNNFEVLRAEHTKLNMREGKNFLTRLIKLIDRSVLMKGSKSSLVKYIILGYSFDAKLFHERILVCGVLRYSKYLSHQKSPIEFFSRVILIYAEALFLSNKHIVYFRSLLNMKPYFEDFKRMNNRFNNEVYDISSKYKKNGESHFLISFLGCVEKLFLPTSGRDFSPINYPFSSLGFFNNELYVEGASYVIQSFEEIKKFESFDLNKSDFTVATSSSFKELLTVACQIKFFKELEIFLESSAYSCKSEGGKTKFVWNDESAGICHTIQAMYSVMKDVEVTEDERENSKQLPTDAELERYLAVNFPRTIERVSQPFNKFEPFLSIELLSFSLLQPKMVFTKEEFVKQKRLVEMLNVTENQYKKFRIRKNGILTLGEFEQISMLFKVIAFSYSRKLTASGDHEAICNGLPIVLGERQLHKIIDALPYSSDKLKEFVDIMAWEAGVGKHLNLQYNPILYIGGRYILMPSLAHGSRLGRNIFFSERMNGNNINYEKEQNYHQLEQSVKALFGRNGFATECSVEIKFKYRGKTSSDIDVIAVMGSNIFLIECKDSVVPTSAYEDRAALAAIEKAGSQLEYNMAALEDHIYREIVLRNLKLPVLKVYDIYGLVVTTNNRFWGYSTNGFAIRSLTELQSFFYSGEWSFGKGSRKYDLWEDRRWNISDFVKFIHPTSSIHRHAYRASHMKYFGLTEKVELQVPLLDIRKLNHELSTNEKIKS